MQDTLVELSKPETEFLTQDEFIEELQEILTLISIPVQPGRGGKEQVISPKIIVLVVLTMKFVKTDILWSQAVLAKASNSGSSFNSAMPKVSAKRLPNRIIN